MGKGGVGGREGEGGSGRDEGEGRSGKGRGWEGEEMEEVCGWEGEGGELRRAGEERGKREGDERGGDDMAIPSSCELVANNFIHVLFLRSLQKP